MRPRKLLIIWPVFILLLFIIFQNVSADEGKNKVVVAAEDAAGQVHEHTLPPLTVDTRPPRVKSAVTWGED